VHISKGTPPVLFFKIKTVVKQVYHNLVGQHNENSRSNFKTKILSS